MDDLISKQKALKAVSFDTEAYMAINMIPSSESVEIVRCKNCCYWDTDWKPTVNFDNTVYHYCDIIDRPTESNFFCAEGVTAKEYFKEVNKDGY